MRQEVSSSAAWGPVRRKGPTNAPEMGRTEYRDGAAPKATEHETEPVKSRAGRHDDPLPPSKDGKGADNDAEGEEIGP